MSFQAQALKAVQEVYRTFGINATYTSSTTTKEVALLQDKNYIIEQGEFLQYKAQSAELDSVAAGDTLTIGTKTHKILNHHLSDDGLEVYLGLSYE